MTYVDKFAEEAVKEVRPIVMTLCQNYEISIDALFVASMEMLAQAFFDQFGAEGDKAKFENRKA